MYDKQSHFANRPHIQRQLDPGLVDAVAVSSLLCQLFPAGCAKHSPSYLLGARRATEEFIMRKAIESPYMPGTAQHDAFVAGAARAYAFIGSIDLTDQLEA